MLVLKSKTSNIDMVKSMRQSTLETIGLGKVIDVFRNGKLPVNTKELVEKFSVLKTTEAQW